ncbi:MAG: glycosyltransferase [Rhodothermia bacterium]|nr:glycosyltransferase [Rhodothermia bacterium]
MKSPLSAPLLTVGLPVRNGENYLEETLLSIQAQTLSDFELVISDNASTDRTGEIAQKFAQEDARVRYYRQPVNIGAAANYSFVATTARGKYFKFAAHDDKIRPDFFFACTAVLERHPEVVLAFPLTEQINGEGHFVAHWPSRARFESNRPEVRLAEALAPTETFPLWGIIRSEVLQKTKLLGNYPGHDVPFLSELALHGRFAEVKEYLFLHREHRNRSIRVYNWRRPHETIEWYDPSRVGNIVFPAWRIAYEIGAAIRRAPLPARDRLRCIAATRHWLRSNAAGLVRDVGYSLGHVPIAGKSIRRFAATISRSKYRAAVARSLREIRLAIPDGNDFILIDEDIFERNDISFQNRQALPLIVRDGGDWGYPGNDIDALNGLDYHLNAGVSYLVFAWPAFWWLNHYKDFASRVMANFDQVASSKRVLVFRCVQSRRRK